MVCSLYFFTARFGLKLDAASGFATLIWAPTGIALASALIFGSRVVLGIFLGAFFTNLGIGASPVAATGIAFGNTLEPFVGAYLLREWANFRHSFDRLRDVIGFLVFGVLSSAAIAATVGATVIFLSRPTGFEGYWETWQAWWFGDAVGALLVSPFILVWSKVPPLKFSKLKIFEGLCIASLSVFLVLIAFGEVNVPFRVFPYMLFPLLIWIAIRFNQYGTVTFVLFVSAVGVTETLIGHGPFAKNSLRQNFFLMNSYLSILSVTGLVLASSLLERRRALSTMRENEENLQFALDAANMGSWDLDLRSDKCMRSLRHDQIFGYQTLQKDWGFKVFLKHVIPEDQPAVEENMKAALENGVLHIEARILRADLSVRWVYATGRTFYDENKQPYRMAGVIMDVTDVKRTELDLREALKSRDEFLSIASHELKTPLTSLTLQIQMARERVTPNEISFGPERLARVFDISGRQIERLTGLVDDLLDASRIHTGQFKFDFKRVDLSELSKEMVSRFSEQMVRANCKVETQISEDVFVWADARRIEQVIANLISNAIKYAAGSQVKISLGQTRSSVFLAVEDTGPGIPLEKQTKIFERFERATNQQISGLGLGLFIVKEIVRGHHGQVRVESAVGKGSRFIVDLPYMTSAQKELG